MATSSVKIWYNKTDAQSILAAAIQYMKYNVPGVTFSVVDTSGKNEAAMLALVTGTNYTDIVVACGTQATYSTAGKFTYDQLALMDGMFTSARRASTVKSGTCGANSTATNIVITGAGGSDDDYIGYNVRTSGAATVYRYITDYTASGEIAVVATTTTPVTTTSAFVVFQNSTNLHIVGNKVSAIEPAHASWVDAFPTTAAPLIVKLLGGTDTSTYFPYAVYDKTATSVASKTLTHTAAFTAGAYNGDNFYVGIESATAGAGEVKQILSNTADDLTLATDWGVTPTGTIKYMITPNKELMLAYLYLPYAIRAYLYNLSDVTVLAEWKELLDKYDFVNTKTSFLSTGFNMTKLLDYAQRGKCVFDAKALGIVS